MKSDLQIAAEAVERERQGLAICCLVPPDQSLEAEALADDMNSRDRQRYIELLCIGIPPAKSAEIVRRILSLPDDQWPAVYGICARYGLSGLR